MEKKVCTNVVEIIPQEIVSLVPMMDENILRNRQLAALVSLERRLLEPYKTARKDAQFHNHLESFKKKKDRKEVAVPDIRVIDPDLKRDLDMVARGKLSEDQLKKYAEEPLSELDRQMLTEGLRGMRMARRKKMNYQEEVSRKKAQNDFFCTEIKVDTSKFVQPGDIVQYHGKYRTVDKVMFQALEEGRWQIEYYSNKVFCTYSQKDSGGYIVRESRSTVRNFDELIDELEVSEEFKSCEIQYVDFSFPQVKFGRKFYPISKVTFTVNTLEKGWKYKLNNLWEEYREALHLSSLCVVELNFSQD